MRKPRTLWSPSLAQSPHGAAKLPVQRLHRARNSASESVPWPCVFVRNTCPVPAHIQRLTLGSVMADV